MGKVYSPPTELGNPPEITDSFDLDLYQEQENNYTQKVIEYAIEYGSGKLAGETIRFAVADGYAEYVVFSLKPVKLIHLPIGDSWRYEFAHRLTAKDISDRVNNQKAVAKLFDSK